MVYKLLNSPRLLSEGVTPFCDPSGDEGYVNWFETGQKTIVFMSIANLSQDQSQQWDPCGGKGIAVGNDTGHRPRPETGQAKPGALISEKTVGVNDMVETGARGC